MLNCRKVLAAVVLVSVGSISTGNSVGASEAMIEEPYARLYFVIPFSIETYIPITIENIEEASHSIWFMKEHEFLTELVRLLQAHLTKQEILSKGVRLKADFGVSRGVFFLDRNGGVLRKDTGATFQLSPAELEQLEKDLASFIGIVDVNAYESYKKKHGSGSLK